MSEQPIHIDICIATYRRPVLLRQLLESIERQQLPVMVFLKIIVVDNDVSESARDVVAAFAGHSLWPVQYDVEPEKNIAKARNRTLSHATGDYVLFVDDDEYADDWWIRNLLKAATGFNADVVFGPVLPVYQDNTPEWIVKGKFFERPRFATGTIRSNGATGNTLVKRYCLEMVTVFFDLQYGVTGGEDIDFFNRIGLCGLRMVWCDEALVYEVVPPERMTIQWLTGRALRGGQTFGRIFKRSLPFPLKMCWLAQRVLYLVIAVFALPFVWVTGRARGVRVLQKVCSSLGHLTSVGRIYYQEYK